MPGAQGRVARAARQPAGALRPDGPDLEIRARIAWNRRRRADVIRRSRQRTRTSRQATRPARPRCRSCQECLFMNRLAPAAALVVLAGTIALLPPHAATALGDEPHRSPIALALGADGNRLLTANQSSGTVSLVDTTSGRVLDEVATGEKPSGVAIAADGTRAVVTHWYGYDLAVLDVTTDKLKVVGRVELGPEPRG